MDVPCARCGEAVDAAATVCPRCDAPVTPTTPVPARARRPRWTRGIVTGSVVVVLALLVGLLAANGGGGDATAPAPTRPAAGGPSRATPPSTAVSAPIDSSSLDAVMLEQSDLGPNWATDGAHALETFNLASESCPGVDGLDESAIVGRTIDLQQGTPDGDVTAEVWLRVRQYRTDEGAARQITARTSPAFLPCVQQEDVDATECTCRATTAASSLGIATDPAPAGSTALLFHDAVGYTNAAGPGTWYVRRAYLHRGRVTVALVAEGAAAIDPPQWETMVRTVTDRLERYLPST